MYSIMRNVATCGHCKYNYIESTSEQFKNNDGLQSVFDKQLILLSIVIFYLVLALYARSSKGYLYHAWKHCMQQIIEGEIMEEPRLAITFSLCVCQTLIRL